ncbi:tyrosinase domain protein [Burkholderia pseudomallei]|uniref:Tyrosinase domain protein n=1 Tax=Burkholderia pseudomallei TaxID=28450 RepID=A0AA40JJ38_BURPE|nr:tyrosinase domain protein [Burkholderia pseudomallei]
MMARSLDDPASWWFFAAIHGEYLTPATTKKIPPDTFPRWSEIQSQPSVPTTPLPNRATQERYWNQCQHGTWYFQMSANAMQAAHEVRMCNSRRTCSRSGTRGATK